MGLAADAFDVAGVSRDNSIPYEGLRETHLPECEFRDHENRKIQYAILTSAAWRPVWRPTCSMRWSGGTHTTTGSTPYSRLWQLSALVRPDWTSRWLSSRNG